MTWFTEAFSDAGTTLQGCPWLTAVSIKVSTTIFLWGLPRDGPFGIDGRNVSLNVILFI